MRRKLLLFLILLSNLCLAQLKIARLFSDHVVLQRQKPIPIWGWAMPKEKVMITLAGQTQFTQTDADGKWKVSLNPMEAGGPYKLTVESKSGSISINDVLIGEVWLCSGQSNMEFRVSQANNYNLERKNANFPQIRHFFVEHEVTIQPQTDLKTGDWKICSEETVGDFTAVGFFFAREIYQKLGIPIGLVHSSWGGSQVEGWISKEGMLSNDHLNYYGLHLPKNWQQADSSHDAKVRKQLFGTNFQPTIADEKKYTDAGYDFSKWHSNSSPLGQWDWKGIWAFRGTGFMAKKVEIPVDFVGQITTLGLGIQDSFNEIYINGTLISAGVQKGIRKIIVPAHSWQVGSNSIVVKFSNMVETPSYGLGVNGSKDDLNVSLGDNKISIASNWKLMPSFAEKHSYVHSSNNIGTTIYNSMIAPILPFGFRGVLWYQGEANASRAYQYRESFPLMINDWRKKWNDDFSFYYVQLANYGDNQSSNQGSTWAELREAQTMTLSLPKTGMAVIIDIGNTNDIHPTNKQDVGHRLALNALQKDYKQDVLISGPVYDSAKIEDAKATISFKYVGKGLITKEKYGYLKGFEVAGEDKLFYYARAEIVGDKVVVLHPKGQKIASVRYAWADSPDDANLFNIDGLPACPFRTDNWKSITEGVKF